MCNDWRIMYVSGMWDINLVRLLFNAAGESTLYTFDFNISCFIFNSIPRYCGENARPIPKVIRDVNKHVLKYHIVNY